jgi:hypothetical protein
MMQGKQAQGLALGGSRQNDGSARLLPSNEVEQGSLDQNAWRNDGAQIGFS